MGYLRWRWAWFWEAYKLYSIIIKEFNLLILIALGSVPGALIRWQLNNDFLVNIIGSMILGFLCGSPFRRNLKLVIGIGFCGSLTTFSGWIFDSLNLMLSGSYAKACILIIYTLLFGLLSAACGLFAARKCFSLPRPFL